jgi:hypothetical protein
MLAKWEEKYANLEAALNADQVEMASILGGTASVEEGLRDDRMAGAMMTNWWRVELTGQRVTLCWTIRSV